VPSLILLGLRSFQKRQCATKIVSRKLGYSCCKKQFACLICWKHIVKTFDKEVMPLCCVPFQKEFWSKSVVLNFVDNKKQICPTNYNILCFCHYKLSFLGVQKGTQLFALVLIFWGMDQMQKHITIGLFKAFETSS
jgi:hypothetical protein